MLQRERVSERRRGWKGLWHKERESRAGGKREEGSLGWGERDGERDMERGQDPEMETNAGRQRWGHSRTGIRGMVRHSGETRTESRPRASAGWGTRGRGHDLQTDVARKHH